MKRFAALAVGLAMLLVPSTATAASISHVVLIVDENHAASQITPTNMPFLTSLGATYARTTHYKAITHPSLPNYFALTSGRTLVTTDCQVATCSTGVNNIYHQGGSNWSQWSESMPSPCYPKHSADHLYAVRHAVPPYYTDLKATCKANDIPLVAKNVPAIHSPFTFITPNDSHNAHSGSLAVADNWLKLVIGQLMKDPAYTNGSTLIELTWDEGVGPVQTVFVNPQLHHIVVKGRYNHYSLLRMNENLLGYPYLGRAATDPGGMKGELGL